MKDAECAETNEKLIFRFLVFEIWSFLYSRLGLSPTKDMQTPPPPSPSVLINFEINNKKKSPIFIFRVIVKNVSKIEVQK